MVNFSQYLILLINLFNINKPVLAELKSQKTGPKVHVLYKDMVRCVKFA